MKKILIVLFLLCIVPCASAMNLHQAMMTVCKGGACATEADSVTGSTASALNPIGSASYNDYAAQPFTAAANATICSAVLRLYRTQTDSSPELTGKVCIYDATGKVINTAWAASTAYNSSTYRRPISANGYVYRQTVASCTSGESEPTWTTTVGATYADNDCSWTNVGLNDAPGSLVGTCSDELNMISSSTTSEGDVAFSNISAAVTSGTKYFVVFYTPTLGDSGDYIRWAYITGVSSPAAYLSGGSTSAMFPSGDGRALKFILYK